MRRSILEGGVHRFPSLITTVLLIICVSKPGYTQDLFFDAKGVRLRYVEQGKGEPIVLLHGVGGNLQAWFDAGVFQNLAADYRVIAMDARGHGKSAKPHDPKQYGSQMALDVVRLLDHLSIKKAHIVGYSMGGNTTSQLLTMQPERFLTATLLAGSGRFKWTKEDGATAELEASEREKECVSRTLIFRLSPAGGPKPSEEDIKQRSLACFADPNQDRFAIAALTRARPGTFIPPAKAVAVKVPTLGIVGNLDGADVLSGFQTLKNLRPNIKLVIVDGATHAGDRGVMRRAEFISALREFLIAHRQTSQR